MRWIMIFVSWLVSASLVFGCNEPEPHPPEMPSPEPMSLAPYETPPAPDSFPEVDESYDHFNSVSFKYNPREYYPFAHKMGYTEGLLLVWQRGSEVFGFVPVGATFALSATTEDRYLFLGIEDGFRLCTDQCDRVLRSGVDSAKLKHMIAERYLEMTGEDVSTQQPCINFDRRKESPAATAEEI